jgi:transmembrane sensor
MTTDGTRRDEAAAWFAVLRRGVVTMREYQRFNEWRADPLNQAALDRMNALWRETAALKTVSGTFHRRKPQRWVAATAAGLVLSIVCGIAFIFLPALTGSAHVRTEIGEQRTATLPDGSIMGLNVVTDVAYRLESHRRTVRLATGEAVFYVRKDSKRPFVVEAGDYEVGAVETTFDIRHRDDITEVSVLEGSVSVRPLKGSQAGREIARLTAGKSIKLSSPSLMPATPQPTTVALQSIAEWRQRTVSYEDASIGMVVEDLNRYFEHPIVIGDARLAGQRVTIRLQVEDRERALRTLSALLGGEMHRGRDSDELLPGH